MSVPIYRGAFVRRITVGSRGLVLWLATADGVSERPSSPADARMLMRTLPDGLHRNELFDALTMCGQTELPPAQR